MQRPVYQKMGITEEATVLTVNGPLDAVAAIDLPMKPDTERAAGRAYDHLILFMKAQQEFNEELPYYKQFLAKNGKLWVSWPKAKKLGTNLDIKEVIRIGYTHGLVESTTLRVDDTWAAIKFTHPKPGKTYQNSYGQLPT